MMADREDDDDEAAEKQESERREERAANEIEIERHVSSWRRARPKRVLTGRIRPFERKEMACWRKEGWLHFLGSAASPFGSEAVLDAAESCMPWPLCNGRSRRGGSACLAKQKEAGDRQAARGCTSCSTLRADSLGPDPGSNAASVSATASA